MYTVQEVLDHTIFKPAHIARSIQQPGNEIVFWKNRIAVRCLSVLPTTPPYLLYRIERETDHRLFVEHLVCPKVTPGEGKLPETADTIPPFIIFQDSPRGTLQISALNNLTGAQQVALETLARQVSLETGLTHHFQ